MGYSRALEHLLAAVELLANPTARKMLEEEYQDTIPNYRIYLEMGDQHLRRAEPFYVEADICEMLAKVVEQEPPSWNLQSDMLPAPFGFCSFQRPLPSWDTTDTSAILAGISWGRFYFKYEGTQTRLSLTPLPGPQAGGHEGYLVRGWFAHKNFPWPGAPATNIIVPVGAQRGFGEDAGDEDAPLLGRLFMALAVFMSQRLLVAPKHQVERALRRRLEKQRIAIEPLVRVVALRRQEYGYLNTPAARSAVEYSCQWMVRGHWRQQACGPQHSLRRPIWVLPYIKGPEDKPLKPPKLTIFDVKR